MQFVSIFAREVVRRDALGAASIVGTFLAFGVAFNYAIEKLADPESVAAHIGHFADRIGTPIADGRLLRLVLRLLGTLTRLLPVAAMLALLGLLVDWSRQVATEDAARQ